MSASEGRSALNRFAELENQVGAAQCGASCRLVTCSSPAPSQQPLRMRATNPQWQEYERRVAERTAEQQSALSKSASLLETMRQRFAPSPAPPDAALVTPRPTLGALHQSLVFQGSSARAPPLAETQPSPPLVAAASSASLKENLAPELSRGTAAPLPRLQHGGAGGAAPAEPDSLLQQASTLFLQQVEDMRRKYTQEVEQLKVGGCGTVRKGVPGG